MIELENEITIIKNLLNKQSIEKNKRSKLIVEYGPNDIKSANLKKEILNCPKIENPKFFPAF